MLFSFVVKFESEFREPTGSLPWTVLGAPSGGHAGAACHLEDLAHLLRCNVVWKVTDEQDILLGLFVFRGLVIFLSLRFWIGE